MKRLILAFSALALYISGLAQTPKKKAPTKITLPAIAAIRPSEIEEDLAGLTDDRFRGREAGTPDELKASVWLAEKARKAGLVPAGEDGTFFQFFSLQRNRIDNNSTIKIDDKPFELWKEVLLPQTAPAEVNAPLIFINASDPSQIDSTSIRGKAVVLMASPHGLDLNMSLPERRYPGFVLRKFSSTLLNNGAAAIIFIADALGEKAGRQFFPQLPVVCTTSKADHPLPLHRSRPYSGFIKVLSRCSKSRVQCSKQISGYKNLNSHP